MAVQRGIGQRVGPYQFCMFRISEAALEQFMYPYIFPDTTVICQVSMFRTSPCLSLGFVISQVEPQISWQVRPPSMK